MQHGKLSGLKVCLALATLYSTFVAMMTWWSRGRNLASIEQPIWAIILLYYGLAVVVGLCVDKLWPLLRSRRQSALLGMLLGWLLAFALSFVLLRLPLTVTERASGALLSGLFLGGPLGYSLWQAPGSR